LYLTETLKGRYIRGRVFLFIPNELSLDAFSIDVPPEVPWTNRLERITWMEFEVRSFAVFDVRIFGCICTQSYRSFICCTIESTRDDICFVLLASLFWRSVKCTKSSKLCADSEREDTHCDWVEEFRHHDLFLIVLEPQLGLDHIPDHERFQPSGPLSAPLARFSL
jgi:hypothetical protein